MSEELSSEGKCLYCNQMYSLKDITIHLANHLAMKEIADAVKKPQTYCHIVVQADILFLHLLVRGNVDIMIIDSFLRNIWMECCGHMSAFMNKRKEIEEDALVKDVFIPKLKITYDYDFGSTTRVFLTGLKNYQLLESEDVILLSRNEPLKIMCTSCKKAVAVSMCSVCNWEMDAFFCKKCAKKHEEECDDFADYSEMPVVNSPRMGVCGYTGGTIDTKRDGVYKLVRK